MENNLIESWHEIRKKGMQYGNPKKEYIQRHHIVEAGFYLGLFRKINYTETDVTNWNDLDIALNHYKLLQQWKIM